jgi:hypothetical protein
MLLALIQLSRDKKLKFILCSIIASLFHYTSLTFLLLFSLLLLIPKSNRIKIMETLIIIAFLFALLGFSILEAGIFLSEKNILPSYFQYALSKGMHYVELESSSRGYKMLLLYRPIVYFYRKCVKNISLNNNYFIFLFTLLMLIEFNLSELVRIGQLYIVIIIIFLPMLLSKIKRNYYQLLYMYIIIYTIYMFMRISFFNTTGRMVRW